MGSAVLAKVWLCHHGSLCSHLCRKVAGSYQNCVALFFRTQVNPSAWHQALAFPSPSITSLGKFQFPGAHCLKGLGAQGKDTGVSKVFSVLLGWLSCMSPHVQNIVEYTCPHTERQPTYTVPNSHTWDRGACPHVYTQKPAQAPTPHGGTDRAIAGMNNIPRGSSVEGFVPCL